MARGLAEFAVGVEEAVVHAPRVDGDAVENELLVPAGDAKAFADVVKEAERIPIQAIREAHGLVEKTMQLFEAEPATLQGAEHGAAAFGAEINHFSLCLVTSGVD